MNPTAVSADLARQLAHERRAAAAAARVARRLTRRRRPPTPLALLVARVVR